MNAVTRAKFFRWCLCFAVSFAIGCKGGIGGAPSGSYGKPVSYAKGRAITFPDFTVEFLGERRVFAKPFGRDFVYHDFKVADGAMSKTVSWSSGTGDIAPTEFVAAGRTFRLALRQADGVGKLGDDELVIQR
jgi:hypothetical protein